MKEYQKMSASELQLELNNVRAEYDKFVQEGLSLDMSRGKPSSEQLDLANEMLSCLTLEELKRSESGLDPRNYGGFDGLPECKALFADMLGVEKANIFVGGNSSLALMYDTVVRSVLFGVCGSKPWRSLEKVKFLCPVPGYDRHFALTEQLGIEMINIPMDDNGPDMKMVKKYVEGDSAVKGIWCVPLYSNPTGISYSDEVVKQFAALKPAAEDFRIYWDNAYCVHHISDKPDTILNIFDECKKQNSEDMVFEFASTSKISFSGAGVAVIAASAKNIDFIKANVTYQTIGYDKINQMRHVKFFKNVDGIKAHMEKHREILKPKFDMVISMLDRHIKPLNIASYTIPNGGYFVSFSTPKGCAKRVCELCKNGGVKLTGAGAPFPYGIDPDDTNIRIAPTYPTVSELQKAMELFCISVKLAALEQQTGKQTQTA